MYPPEAEHLTIENLLKGYTVNPAYALRLDDEIGTIEAGKYADCLVLEEDLFNEDIARTAEMGISNLPTICIDGEQRFVSLIPSREELISAVREYLK